MSRRKRRALLVASGVVLVGVAVGAGLWYADAGTPGASSDASPTAAPSGATSSSAAASTARPSLPTAVAAPTAGQPVATERPVRTAGGSVAVLIGYAGWEAPPGVSSMDGQSGSVQVNGLVSGVIENGGTCHVSLTKGAVQVTGQSTGVADAKVTDCSVRITDPRITPGTWSAVLRYHSSTSDGTSSPATVQVSAR
jgi:hypothetical protein